MTGECGTNGDAWLVDDVSTAILSDLLCDVIRKPCLHICIGQRVVKFETLLNFLARNSLTK